MQPLIVWYNTFHHTFYFGLRRSNPRCADCGISFRELMKTNDFRVVPKGGR